MTCFLILYHLDCMARKHNITLFYNTDFQYLSKSVFKWEFPGEDIISEAY